MNIKEIDKQYIAGTYSRFDLQIDHGHGAVLYDDQGNEFIDFGSGIAVNSFGLCDKKWEDALIAQIRRVQHTSNLYYCEPQAKLAQLLCEKTGMKKVFFSNSGAEANECAIKTARKYASDKYRGERDTIVTLTDSFHGRTITTLSATGQETFHKDFGPFTPGFAYAKANDADDLKKAVSANNVCAIMFELIQGEGGVNVLTKEFVGEIQKICKENDILMVIDEVQTGNGRTGSLYCYMDYGLQPDIVSTAKGLAGGLPIGATLLGEKVQETLTPSSHGSTFGGNPICASGALSILERLDGELLGEVKIKSRLIRETLENTENVEAVTGIGLLLGVKTKKDAKAVVGECLKRGLLVLTAKDKVRLLPPLNITFDELEKGLKILKEVIEA